MQHNIQGIKIFKGLKNDEDSKQIPMDYFFKIKNFTYSDTGLLGMNKMLMPKLITTFGSAVNIDGIVEYRFLNSSNVLVTEHIAVINGLIYKNILTTPALISSTFAISPGKCTFAIFNDKLYIANGKDYVTIYDGNKGILYQMGAPEPEILDVVGNLNGYYQWAVTYTTAGGEEIIGSYSDVIHPINQKATLSLPIGYSGTLSRNIYRRTLAGTFYYVATVSDNTTLTYVDNIADGALTTPISAANNELPKPYFLAVANQKLYGTVVDKYPTQVFITDTNVELFDAAAGLDVANYGIDNTAVKGIEVDFNKIIIGTERNMILIDPSTDTPIITRANVGLKSGYSMKRLPAAGEFPGGVMFVSNLNDVRVMVGLQALPVSTSLDNVRADNWAQNIRGELERALMASSNIHAEFYNYKYHLLVDYIQYIFDIRLMGWVKKDIQTASYQSKPYVLGILNNKLYNGQVDGTLEQEYYEVQYKSEDVEAYIESPHIEVGSRYAFIEKYKLWFLPGNNTDMNIQITLDENTAFTINQDFTIRGGVFDISYYNSDNYQTDRNGMDYKVININKLCRWLKYKLTCTIGNISYQGFEIYSQDMSNKEVA